MLALLKHVPQSQELSVEQYSSKTNRRTICPCLRLGVAMNSFKKLFNVQKTAHSTLGIEDQYKYHICGELRKWRIAQHPERRLWRIDGGRDDIYKNSNSCCNLGCSIDSVQTPFCLSFHRIGIPTRQSRDNCKSHQQTFITSKAVP